jgi:hypothetical protein
VNVELKEKYELSAFSSIEYCVNDTIKQPLGNAEETFINVFKKNFKSYFRFIDALDIFAAVLVMGLLALLITSSLFDRYLRNLKGPDAETHYNNLPESKIYQILTLFSARRNWYILMKPPKPEYKDLQFIQALRILTMWLVTFGHGVHFAGFLPSSNTERNELVSHQTHQIDCWPRFDYIYYLKAKN